MISANVVEEVLGGGWVRDDIRQHDCDGYQVQEELWRKGNCVEVRHSGKTVKALSGENPCLQSLFTNFDETQGTYIVIRESSRLRIYSPDGEEFLVALPLPLGRVWSSAFGLVLEGNVTVAEATNMPQLLALHHPLEDFTRIVAKKGAQMVEWRRGRRNVIKLLSSNSLVVTYDNDCGLHSIWKLRKCDEEDLANVTDVIGTPMMRHSFKNSSSRLLSSFSVTPNSRSISMEARSSARPTPNNSLGRICRSPSVAKSRLNSLLLASTAGANEGQQIRNPEEPQPPDLSLCLEHLWTEPHQCGAGPSRKVFTAIDLVGKQYLAFLKNGLHILEYDPDILEFGLTLSVIPDLADATPCHELGMILTLDHQSRLSLYSGAVRVCGVHFNYSPSVQMSHIAQEIATLHIDSSNSQNIVTSSRPASALDPKFFSDDSVLLSPVSSEVKTPTVKFLHGVLDSTACLEYNNGAFVRLALPKTYSSSLIGRCFKAMKSALGETCSVLLAEWYSLRNSPGPSSISNAQEWNMFAKCIMKLMGYHTESINFSTEGFPSATASRDSSMSSPCSSKKMKHSDDGCDGDWQYLLATNTHYESGQQLSFVLGIDYISPDPLDNSNKGSQFQQVINKESPLFPYICKVFMALHLLFEDCKLNKFCWNYCPLLASLLSRIAADLGLEAFVQHYWRDFPTVCHMDSSKAKTGQIQEKIKTSDLFGHDTCPPSIFPTLEAILLNKPLKRPKFPIICGVTDRTQDILLVFALFAAKGKLVQTEDYCRDVFSSESSIARKKALEATKHKAGRIVDFLVDRGYNWWAVQSIPIGFILPILASIYECRISPPPGGLLNPKAYVLIGRPELDPSKTSSLEPQKMVESPANEGYVDDGLDDIEDSEIARLRWPKDRRVSEVRKLLQSARPVIIGVQQKPGVSDHDFVEEQERNLQSLCIRTMALPVGRGALAFQTAFPLPTEPVSIPKLCLNGKAPPRGTTVEMDHIDVVPHMDHWPSFHNGVAAGLRVPSDVNEIIDSTWITFNKPKESPNGAGNPNDQVEHGGFLMALGLNGHLAKLGKLESFDYLIRGNEMISIGLLLGMSAAKRGSMDILATKKISTQLEALLPPTATELPLSHTTQVAGLVGLGLLYQGTGHRHMAEVCLGELGRPPGPELENCTDRESYSLAAGLALGMITLGQGESLSNGALRDLNLPESLFYHMVGGPRPETLCGGRSKFRSPSYQVQEGDTINIDVTSPGATLALGLMFFRSGNARVASWLEAPDSRFLLEFVRPDFLMLRTLARGLIMWDEILPSTEWIVSHVPATIRPHCMVRPSDDENSNIDYETINQAYCNLVAGASLAMGMRFAGTANKAAFKALYGMTKKLLAISKRSVAELAGKATMEQTICILVLSLSLVMAGTGDLDVIRLVRFLRSRVGPNIHSTVTYGSHMALHMGLGLLFLGGGRFTLNTKPESVAALVAAFFPKFPTHSNDNRYHLQALRHLYVLAAEPRLLIPKDISTNKNVFAHVSIEFRETMWYDAFNLRVKAPCMLPELHLLKRISIDDERYHKVTFDDLESLRRLLNEGHGLLRVKKKAGCLSYEEDPKGFRSLTAQVLTQDTSFHWSLSASSALLASFSSEPGVSCFAKAFVRQENTPAANSNKYEEVMGSLLYECASHEKLDLLLAFWIAAFQLQWQIERPGHFFVGPQLAIISAMSRQDQSLICPEIVASISQSLKSRLDIKKPSRGSKMVDLMAKVEINSLLSYEGLSDIPLDADVSARNSLWVIKSKILGGKASHALSELTKNPQ